MRNGLLLPLVAAGGFHVLSAQRISTSDSTTPHFESYLAVDPHDPAHLIAISSVLRLTGKEGSNIYTTFDGGTHWQRAVVSDSLLDRGGDGLVYLPRDGGAYMVMGARVRDRVATVVGRSADGGRHWTSWTALPYRDRPWMAVDTNDDESVYDGAMYLVGQENGLLVSRSTDTGRTWSYGDRIARDEGGPDRNASVHGIAGNILIGAKGNVLIPYRTWSIPHVAEAHGADSVYTGSIALLVSENAGRSWLAVRHGPAIHDVSGYRGNEALGTPTATIDGTRGPNQGRVYLAYADFSTDLDRYVIRVARSGDEGQTWAVTAASDSAMLGAPSNIAVAVNRDGILALTWYDRRDDPAHHCWRLYGAISTDGGEHFGRNVRMSDPATCTNTPGNWILETWDQYDEWTDSLHPRPGFGLVAMVPVRFVNGGETQGLVADRDGVFHSAWINGPNGVLQLWHTSFAVDSDVAERVRHENAARQAVAGATGPPGSEDLSTELRFEMSQPTIDFAAGALTVTMRVVNPTASRVIGPVSVQLSHLLNPRAMGMGLSHLAVANADNGVSAEGARWTFASGSGGGIAPHGKSEARVLRFHFDGGVPALPDGYFEPTFTIYGRRYLSNHP